MGRTKRFSWKFIGASAGLHLMIVGIMFYTLKPLRSPSRPPVSVIQVSLVSPVENSTVSPVALRPLRTPLMSSVATPAQPRTTKPVKADAADQTDTASFPSEPVPEQTTPTRSDNARSVEPSSGSYRLESSSSPNPSATVSGSRQDELTRFLQDVTGRLEWAKQYPWLARIQGQEGTARVQFMINPSGEVQAIRLLESSRSRILDDEAVATVKRVGRFPHPPMTWNKNIQIQVPLVFQLQSP